MSGSTSNGNAYHVAITQTPHEFRKYRMNFFLTLISNRNVNIWRILTWKLLLVEMKKLYFQWKHVLYHYFNMLDGVICPSNARSISFKASNPIIITNIFECRNVEINQQRTWIINGNHLNCHADIKFSCFVALFPWGVKFLQKSSNLLSIAFEICSSLKIEWYTPDKQILSNKIMGATAVGKNIAALFCYLFLFLLQFLSAESIRPPHIHMIKIRVWCL